MSNLTYRPDIDGLRAVAVTSVLLYHIAPRLLPGGFLGVDIFFVISGYLITLIILREQEAGTFSFTSFYGRRVRRLFPALSLVLFAVLTFGSFALFADEWQQLGRHSAKAVVFLQNIQLIQEAGYFDVVSDAKPLLHLWSLSVEEQFYLLWPATIFLFLRLRIYVAAAICILFLGSFLFTLGLASHDLNALYFHPLARFWELLAGAVVAWCHYAGFGDALPVFLRSNSARMFCSVTGLGLLLFSLIYITGEVVWPGFYTMLPLLGSAMLLVSGQAAFGNYLLSRPLLVWIGLVSYPLYLWHWPILSYIRIMESGDPAPQLLWLGGALSLILAAITYYFVEKPLRYSGKRHVKGLVAAMLALFVVSEIIVACDGMPHRAALQYIADAEIQMKREPQQDEECLSRFPGGQAPVYCRAAGPSDSTLALIGDSHAHVLFPGIAALAEKQGLGTILLANSGCPPLLDAVTGRNKEEREACRQSILTIIDAVENDEHIKSVVFVSRGPIYLEGKGFGPPEAHYKYPPIASGDGLSKSPDEVFLNGLISTANRITRAGKKFAYFLEVPELGMSARDCLHRPLSILRNGGCEVPYEVYAHRMQPYRKIVSAAAEQAGFTVIDPEPLFCNEAVCHSFDAEEKLLYADDDHLSINGSYYVAPLVIAGILHED